MKTKQKKAKKLRAAKKLKRTKSLRIAGNHNEIVLRG
jgi:hypothetical protein